jgi:hypothetical protein
VGPEWVDRRVMPEAIPTSSLVTFPMAVPRFEAGEVAEAHGATLVDRREMPEAIPTPSLVTFSQVNFRFEAGEPAENTKRETDPKQS